MFSDSNTKAIAVTLKAHKENETGKVSLNLPEGWKSEPKSIAYNLAKKGEVKVVVFNVTPSAKGKCW